MQKIKVSLLCCTEGGVPVCSGTAFRREKKLVVIDEFPYMCRDNRGIPSILQNLWDAELKDHNVMIILCGSSLSFIEKELLSEKNPFILTKGSVLYSEVDFLLHQELRETPVYNSIIEAVALGNTRLNDISQKSLVNNPSKTSVYLKSLVEFIVYQRKYERISRWRMQV